MKFNLKKIYFCFLCISFLSFSVAETFNNHLTEEERATLQKGEILIKKINYSRYICLNNGLHEAGDLLIKNYKDLSPKYLAEVIQIKPYAGNEDLPERMEKLLSNISDYAGIPYYSERHDAWWDLYSSAKIVSETENEYGKEYLAEIDMTPFGIVKQQININQYDDVLLYDSINLNKLSYFDRFDCVFPKKMKMSILLLRDGDNWVLYGIGGVNAPRIPFFTERIDTSFINRIKTFCYYIFEKL